MKAALKYCGGCNPDYDRVEAGNRLVRAFANRLKWVSPLDPEVELVVVIAGCETACVDPAPFEGKDVVLIKCENDVEASVLEMEKLLSLRQAG